jgi:poly(hydroxyalkanoate) depolymerase family esterase
MARRPRSLFAAMMPTPTRRPARRRTAAAKPLSLPAVPSLPNLSSMTSLTSAPARSGRTRARPAAASRPGGKGSWTEHQHLGPTGARGYSLYIPAGLRRASAVPLVMMLHGCTQTPAEFAAATRFNALADRQGMVVVYPQQTAVHNLNRCWNWFEPLHQSRLTGEPAILAGLVRGLLAETVRFTIDPTRIYVAGISAGGGMAMALGATFPDVFAGVAVHSGPPFKSASGGRDAFAAMAGRSGLPELGEIPARALGMPPTIVFQGTRDTTVRPAAAAQVTEQWLAVSAAARGATDPRRVVRSRTTTTTAGTRPATVTRWYSARGRVVLESWLITGLGHAWSGGLPKGSFSDPVGPRATTQLWRFLSAQRLGV